MISAGDLFVVIVAVAIVLAFVFVVHGFIQNAVLHEESANREDAPTTDLPDHAGALDKPALNRPGSLKHQN
jgi:hypothetical protein